jgi:hypothetical protein
MDSFQQKRGSAAPLLSVNEGEIGGDPAARQGEGKCLSKESKRPMGRERGAGRRKTMEGAVTCNDLILSLGTRGLSWHAKLSERRHHGPCSNRGSGLRASGKRRQGRVAGQSFLQSIAISGISVLLQAFHRRQAMEVVQ